MVTRRKQLRSIVTCTVVAGALLTAGCSGSSRSAAQPEAEPTAPKTEVTGTRLAVSYAGGVLVLDRDSLEPVADLQLPGFLRLNPAGDQRHLLVSTEQGFQVLDTGVEVKGHGDHNHYYAGKAAMTDILHPAPEPGHVVRHNGRTALFSDGAGTVHVVDPSEITDPNTAAAEPTWIAPDPHHGVAVPLADDGLFVSVGTEEGRTGAAVLDADHQEVASSDECPDLHGEATAANGTVLAGCTDGVLLWKDDGRGGEFVKIDSPDKYGRIGNQAGSPESDVVLGDYKTDPDAELERPTQVSLIDTADETIELLELDASYSFRSLGRGPSGEALVLGTDGTLRVIDPEKAEVTDEIEVTDSWQEPVDWQDPRPTLYVEGDTAWVTEPATKTIHVVYLPSKEVVDSITLPEIPNELTGVGEAADHDH